MLNCYENSKQSIKVRITVQDFNMGKCMTYVLKKLYGHVRPRFTMSCPPSLMHCICCYLILSKID